MNDDMITSALKPCKHMDIRMYDEGMKQVGPTGRIFCSSYDQVICVRFNEKNPDKWEFLEYTRKEDSE